MTHDTVYLTPQQVSARFAGRITVRTLANWRSKKIGPPFKKIGGRVLYPMAALLNWEALDKVVEQAALFFLGGDLSLRLAGILWRMLYVTAT